MESNIKKRVSQHLREAIDKDAVTEKGWFIIAPYGSMNYGLYDYDSDVDSKIIKVPNMKEIIKNIGSRGSLTRTLNFNNEKIEIKDTREFFRILKTGSINFMEILFSDYIQVNSLYEEEWNLLCSKREALAYAYPENTLSSSLGMAKTKYRNLERQDYDNCNLKDFMTLMRLEFFVKNYLEKVPYKKCITVEDLPEVQELWLKFKHQKTINVEGFNRILLEAQLIVSRIASMVENSNMKTDYSMDNFIYDINNKLILKRIEET